MIWLSIIPKITAEQTRTIIAITTNTSKGSHTRLPCDEAYLLSAYTIREMYNRKVLDKMHWNFKETSSDARKDARIGTIKMFENSGNRSQFMSTSIGLLSIFSK